MYRKKEDVAVLVILLLGNSECCSLRGKSELLRVLMAKGLLKQPPACVLLSKPCSRNERKC